MRSLLLLMLLLLAGGADLSAQQLHADSVQHRNSCRLAEQVIRTGHPAPHTDWALRFIASCGAETYASAVTGAVLRLRTESDLSVLGPYWYHSRYLLDASLFEAAYSIASDRSASQPSRVLAMLALIYSLRNRMQADYADLVGGFDEHGDVRGGCATTVGSGWHYRQEGAPLPSDYVQRVRNLAESISADASEPEDVRTAASCAESEAMTAANRHSAAQ